MHGRSGTVVIVDASARPKQSACRTVIRPKTLFLLGKRRQDLTECEHGGQFPPPAFSGPGGRRLGGTKSRGTSQRHEVEDNSALTPYPPEPMLIYFIINRNTRRGLIFSIHLLPGFTAGTAAKSAGNLSASNVSTCNAIKLNIGTPRSTVPPERSTSMPTPKTSP